MTRLDVRHGLPLKFCKKNLTASSKLYLIRYFTVIVVTPQFIIFCAEDIVDLFTFIHDCQNRQLGNNISATDHCNVSTVQGNCIQHPRTMHRNASYLYLDSWIPAAISK